MAESKPNTTNHDDTKPWPRWILWLLLGVLAAIALFAAAWVGYLFGVVIGRSVSPVSAIAAPLVFGLLAVAGIGAGMKGDFSKGGEVLRGILVALGVAVFCSLCQYGIDIGVERRLAPFRPMTDVLGDAWPAADVDVRTSLYKLRWEMQARNMSRREFESAIRQMVAPVLASNRADKQKAALAAVSQIEKALPAKP